MIMMMTVPQNTSSLQKRVESVINSKLSPLYCASYEHIAVSANDQGEVWLSGLVDDPNLAEMAVRIAKGVTGVHYVFNYVTVRYTRFPDRGLFRHE